MGGCVVNPEVPARLYITTIHGALLKDRALFLRRSSYASEDYGCGHLRGTHVLIFEEQIRICGKMYRSGTEMSGCRHLGLGEVRARVLKRSLLETVS